MSAVMKVSVPFKCKARNYWPASYHSLTTLRFKIAVSHLHNSWYFHQSVHFWEIFNLEQSWKPLVACQTETMTQAFISKPWNIIRPSKQSDWSTIRSTVQKFPAWPTFQGDRNKTTLLFFNIVSIYFNTLFNWYINLTIDGTIYPSHHFPFGAAFVCQAGNFFTLLRIIKIQRKEN